MPSKKQRQEVEDSCLDFFFDPNCFFFFVRIKQTATHKKMEGVKNPERIFHELKQCDILLIHTGGDRLMLFSQSQRGQRSGSAPE